MDQFWPGKYSTTIKTEEIQFEVDFPINNLDWKDGLSHMVLVFMSCVKDTPQETAYSTVKIKLHDHSFSCSINEHTHLLNEQDKSMSYVLLSWVGS